MMKRKQKQMPAEQKIKDGAFAFYEAMAANGDTSAQKALEYLNSSEVSENDPSGQPISSYTKRGDADDATSLEHMKAALDYIKECNEIRAENGLDPLQVNDVFMAYARQMRTALHI